MNYQVAILPMPAATTDVQDLINNTVPAANQLVSVAVFGSAGAFKIMIVYK